MSKYQGCEDHVFRMIVRGAKCVFISHGRRFYSHVGFENLHFHPSFDPQFIEPFRASFLVYKDFVTEEEESNFMLEMEPHLKRHIYEKNHWDDAIQGFRETERKFFNKTNTPIIERIKQLSFPSEGKDGKILPYTHVLDLAKDGVIKPHVDSSRFCGSTVAVLSLLSDSVGRLCLEKDKDQIVDVFIPRRSLYIMKGVARYDFTHEILHNEQSMFRGRKVDKDRRISVICRNEA